MLFWFFFFSFRCWNLQQKCGSNSPANVPCTMIITQSQFVAGWALFRACDKKTDRKADLNYSYFWLQLPSSSWTSPVTSASQFPPKPCTCGNNGVLMQALLPQGETWAWEVEKAWSEPRKAFPCKICGVPAMVEWSLPCSRGHGWEDGHHYLGAGSAPEVSCSLCSSSDG